VAKLSEFKEDIARKYFEEGRSYQEIANEYGKSREAVRQFLNRHFPDREPGRKFRSALRAEDRADREAARAMERRIDAPPCVVCGDPVTRSTGGRGKRKTCSPAHSKLWARARFLLDPELREAQRQSMARSILRYRGEHKQSAVNWATKVVNGEPINSRTYVMEGSLARQAYDEVMRIRAEKGYTP
jgi:predicted transcriptional regulator